MNVRLLFGNNLKHFRVKQRIFNELKSLIDKNIENIRFETKDISHITLLHTHCYTYDEKKLGELSKTREMFFTLIGDWELYYLPEYATYCFYYPYTKGKYDKEYDLCSRPLYIKKYRCHLIRLKRQYGIRHTKENIVYGYGVREISPMDYYYYNNVKHIILSDEKREELSQMYEDGDIIYKPLAISKNGDIFSVDADDLAKIVVLYAMKAKARFDKEQAEQQSEKEMLRQNAIEKRRKEHMNNALLNTGKPR